MLKVPSPGYNHVVIKKRLKHRKKNDEKLRYFPKTHCNCFNVYFLSKIIDFKHYSIIMNLTKYT